MRSPRAGAGARGGLGGEHAPFVVVNAPRGLWRVDDALRGSASEGLAWCEGWLSGYDLSKLSRLTVRDGSERKVPPGVWGYCYYPTKTLPSYRITCSPR